MALKRCARRYCSISLPLALLSVLLLSSPAAADEYKFIRGDADADGRLGLADPLRMMSYQFARGTAVCLDAMDVSDDGRVSLLDTVSLLNYVYDSGSPPAAPAGDCGEDPTDDGLDCAGPSSFCPPLVLGEAPTAEELFQAEFYAVGEDPTAIAPADVNGDGFVDLAVSFAGSDGGVSILLNQGDGTFGTNTDYEATCSAHGLIANDFIGDSSIDLAVATCSENGLCIFEGAGDGTFDLECYGAKGGAGPTALVAGNNNANSYVDLFQITSNLWDYVFVWNNDKGEKFTPLSYHTDKIGMTAGTGADFDADGDLDLAISASGGVILLSGHGDHHFGQKSATAGSKPSAIASGDFDLDGDIDLAVMNSISDDVSLHMNDGDMNFASAEFYDVGDEPMSMAVDDFDGDGDLDLATINAKSKDLTLLYNDGSGEFEDAATLELGGEPVAIAAVDLSGDGRPDLVFADAGADGVSVIVNDGEGKFEFEGSRYATVAAGNKPVAIVAADLNGDHKADLATVSQVSRDLTVIISSGNSGFAIETAIELAFPYDLVAADLDIDGRPDLCATNTVLTTIHLNDGEGGFEAGQQLQDTGGRLAAVGYFDEDADLDLALLSPSAREVTVYRNDGHATFDAAGTLMTGLSPSGIFATDIDGDGDSDLMVADKLADEVLFFINTGSAEFEEVVRIDVGDGAAEITGADFDGDQDIDLAVACPFAHEVTLLANDGGGEFEVVASYTVAGAPVSVTAGDLSGDGRPDLVLPAVTRNVVNVLLNDGSGGFGDLSMFSVGDHPVAAALGDFDADGDLDIATANELSDDVTVLYNQLISD